MSETICFLFTNKDAKMPRNANSDNKISSRNIYTLVLYLKLILRFKELSLEISYSNSAMAWNTIVYLVMQQE